jgi:hypothetical protein
VKPTLLMKHGIACFVVSNFDTFVLLAFIGFLALFLWKAD